MTNVRRMIWASVAFLACLLPIHARTVTWQLQDALFPDGTMVTGSFMYDASSNAYTSLHLSTLGGTSIPPTSTWFFDSCEQCTTAEGFQVVDSSDPNLAGAHLLSLWSLTAQLTDAGGIVPIEWALAATCASADCTTYDDTKPSAHLLVSGAFVGNSSTPEPASLLLCGSALFFAVVTRRLSARPTP